MMQQEWKAILNRYGQQVILSSPEQGEKQVKAFVQPVLDRQAQLQPSALGMGWEERAIYLGPGDSPVYPRRSTVIWRGKRYEVRSTRQVENGHHVWAVLQRMEENT